MGLASVEIKGDEQLLRVFNTLPKKITRQLQLKAIRKGSLIFQKEAKKRVPKDEKVLMKSIGIVPDKLSKNTASLYVAVRKGKRAVFDGWYGWFQERGTKGFGKRSRSKGDVAYHKRGTGLPAQPFYEPAWEATHQSVYNSIKEFYRAVVATYLKTSLPMFYKK